MGIQHTTSQSSPRPPPVTTKSVCISLHVLRGHEGGLSSDCFGHLCAQHFHFRHSVIWLLAILWFMDRYLLKKGHAKRGRGLPTSTVWRQFITQGPHHYNVFAGSSKPVFTRGSGLVAIFNSCKKSDRFLASTAFDYEFESTEGQRTEAEYSPDNFNGVTEGRRE